MTRLVLTAALLSLSCLLASCHPHPVAQPVPAPAWQLADLDGRIHSLAAERGRPVLLHFGASW